MSNNPLAESQAVDVIDAPVMRELERATRDSMIENAHKYPRSLEEWYRDTMSDATMSLEVAMECGYAVPRDNKTIVGPSVRLAEIAYTNYGNCSAGARVISEEERFIVAEGFFFDAQKNSIVQHAVRRSIWTRHGRMRDNMLQTVSQAACSIAFRDAVFKGLGKARIMPIYREVMKLARGTEADLPSIREKAFAYILERWGIEPDQVATSVGCGDYRRATLEDMFRVRLMVTAINDGELGPEQAFTLPKSKAKADSKPLTEGERQKLSENLGFVPPKVRAKTVTPPVGTAGVPGNEQPTDEPTDEELANSQPLDLDM